MRLIDADALPRQKMLEAFGNGQYEDVEIVYGNDIDNAPTIDPFKDKSLEQIMDECFNMGYRKAVRHGKWEVAGETTHYYICSICGRPGDWVDRYCRSCGARMDGGKGDE
ncbi:hypothetical protein IJI17_02135 [Candidatus Saccharibacteria bacterium]|nr:hypothetical protein [Achromobacter sp.]MBQ2649459.1 hypothetical protein [Achromobacter sp.]MBQ3839349.1 hypothetical protein [Fibrobacter sp.]MBQ6320997.1 hypothetical protein [Candidatus Saccharibacteria bacterium]